MFIMHYRLLVLFNWKNIIFTDDVNTNIAEKRAMRLTDVVTIAFAEIGKPKVTF